MKDSHKISGVFLAVLYKQREKWYNTVQFFIGKEADR